MAELEEVLAEIRKEMVDKVIAIPGHKPVGIVAKVDEYGAWLDDKCRITIEGLVFYHPLKEGYQNTI